MAVTQKINLAALAVFMLLVLSFASAFGICIESQLTLCGSVRAILHSGPQQRQAESFTHSQYPTHVQGENGNKSVTYGLKASRYG
jgi:hypothetical protein